MLDLDSTHMIFKDKVPRAKEEMEEKLQVNIYCFCIRTVLLFYWEFVLFY